MRIARHYLCLIFFLINTECFAEYFQQEVNYSVEVSLDDKHHMLSAFETITYHNNSKDTLREIYFHLYPNAYSDNNTCFAKEVFGTGDDRIISAHDSERGYIDSLNFRINGEDIRWSLLTDTIDVCRLILNRPIYPSDSILITTPFRVKIPAAYMSRLGHEKQAYYLTQWYPKPAVYDKNGWNYFPYMDVGEYYSEFGSFDVSITLPENYVLAATGIMQNADAEYRWLLQKDSLTRKITEFPVDDPFPSSSKNFKTINFYQENIHDFAWFADKRWNVLFDEITLPSSGKKVSSWSFFLNTESRFWLKANERTKDALIYFSKWIGEYPYDAISCVDVGSAMGGGMEYPMIATIGHYGDDFEHELTIAHEVCHNWFYGILGNNERCHAWMDEGLTNFYEMRYAYTKYENDSAHRMTSSTIKIRMLPQVGYQVNNRNDQVSKYLSGARQNIEQSPELSSEKININNYHHDVYYKAGITFDYLKYYLGDSLFDICMREYFREWSFRHPSPADMKIIIERMSGKNLSWLFEDFLASTKKLDYHLVKVKPINETESEATVANCGEINCPVPLQILSDGKVTQTNWLHLKPGKDTTVLFSGTGNEIAIDAEERMPELETKDNFMSINNGKAKRNRKIKLSPLTNAEDKKRRQIFYSPVVGWNNYNKFMAGVVFHNYSALEKKFEYAIMPMYAFGTNTLTGGAHAAYHFYPIDSKIRRITMRMGISSYSFAKDEYEYGSIPLYYLNYSKLDSRLVFDFRQKSPEKNISNDLTLRNIYIMRDIPYFVNYRKTEQRFVYWEAEYRRENHNPLAQSIQKINLLFGENFFTAQLEAKNFFSYGKKRKGFSTRTFFGLTRIPESGTSGIDYRMSLSGRDGSGDYLFDEVFMGRTETKGMLSQQFVSDYAGFKAPTSFYRLAQDWMGGININTTLPGILPFRLFANAGIFDDSDFDGRYGKISWEIGVDLPVIKDIFVIYLPFAYSSDIKNAIEELEYNTGELIRFELHFNSLNPLEQIKDSYYR